MNIGITIVRSRRSIRKYRDTPVPEQVIADALECARQAPTAKNEQPWIFGTVREAALRKQIADLTDNGKFIAQAPVCFAVFSERSQKYYLEDGCAATMQLILGLWSFGVASCWVAGDKKPYAENVRKLLDVPEKYTLVALVPAGYPAEMKASEFIVKKKDIEEIAFNERYVPPR